jgi:hypothetical protein
MAAKKPKPSAKKRPKKAQPTSDPAQSARFVKMAQELGAEDSEPFERAVRVLISPKKSR